MWSNQVQTEHHIFKCFLSFEIYILITISGFRLLTSLKILTLIVHFFFIMTQLLTLLHVTFSLLIIKY